jgi:hypothetical protein
MKFHSYTYFLVTANEDFPSISNTVVCPNGCMILWELEPELRFLEVHPIELTKKVTSSDLSVLSTPLGINPDAPRAVTVGRRIAEKHC